MADIKNFHIAWIFQVLWYLK